MFNDYSPGGNWIKICYNFDFKIEILITRERSKWLSSRIFIAIECSSDWKADHQLHEYWKGLIWPQMNTLNDFVHIIFVIFEYCKLFHGNIVQFYYIFTIESNLWSQINCRTDDLLPLPFIRGFRTCYIWIDETLFVFVYLSNKLYLKKGRKFDWPIYQQIHRNQMVSVFAMSLPNCVAIIFCRCSY